MFTEQVPTFSAEVPKQFPDSESCRDALLTVALAWFVPPKK